MSIAELSRVHLEALLVAQAVLDPPVAEELLRALDHSRVSGAARAILRGIATCGLEVPFPTQSQRELRDRAGRVMLSELRGPDRSASRSSCTR
jgi:hypothetical protein